MKKLILSSKLYFVICILFLHGCPQVPMPGTTRAGFFIVNKSTTLIYYQVKLSEIWSEKASIEPHAYDYIYGYEIDAEESQPPEDIQLLRLFAKDCELEMRYENFKKYIIRNQEGRTAWDLVINDSFLTEQGCAKTDG